MGSGASAAAGAALRPFARANSGSAGSRTHMPATKEPLAPEAGLEDRRVPISVRRMWQSPQAEQPRGRFVVRMNESAVQVANGVPFSGVCVGGACGRRAWAQNPPQRGDSWTVEFEAEIGGYEIHFVGGNNPHHGMLTVEIDGEQVGVVDQYEISDTFPSDHILYWECDVPGNHTLQGSVMDKSPTSLSYWICLARIEFEPVPLRCTTILLLEASRCSQQACEIKCTTLSGQEVLVLECDVGTTVRELQDVVQKHHTSAWKVALTLPDASLLGENRSENSLAQVFTL